MEDEQPQPVRERLQGSASRSGVSDYEMRRRAESVSQAAMIVRQNEARARKKTAIGVGITIAVVIALYFIAC